MSISDCVDENLSEVESSDSNDETDENQPDYDSEQCDKQATPVASAWHDVKWQKKICLPGVQK
jgi:hypothetical protein